MAGSLRRIDDQRDPEYQTSLDYLTNTHPRMKAWLKVESHGFAPYASLAAEGQAV